MNTNPKDAPVPSHHGCLLPAVARMSSVTQVTPAKKITFLKRGDPRFSGVRLAVHQRTFKSFGALMDELSQRVPLPFGVRCVTTPRGLHGVSALEQLEDGGCYLCSDKMPPRTASVSGSCEVPGTSSSYKAAKGPRRLLLVKNEDPRFQHTVALSHRNTRTLTAFLSKASALLHFPVKQVYTTSGEKVDSLKSLLHGPSVFVCAGHEPFRPLAMEGGRRTETSSEQTLKNKNGSWGPKAKRSVIHARTGSGSRPRWPFLLSENTGLSNPPETQPQAWLDKHPQDMSVPLDPMVAGDNVEKKVHMNEDGSLSVEMKVRFHFLGEDTLLWSRLTGRGARSQTSGELGPPSSASIHFQDLQGVNSGSLSNSNYSSHLYPSNSSSTETSDTGVTTGRIVKASGGCSPCQGPKQEDMSDMSLGTLPCASPGAMVREWLSHIPEEPLLVKAEMVDQTLGMIGVDSGSVQEDHAIKCSPVGLGKTTQVRQPSLEGVISEDQEPGAVLPMAGNAGLYSEGGPPPSGVANTPQEAGVGKEAAVGVEGLPPRVSAHAHIIKVLLDSKRGRPSSLPEVSGKQASKLSHSAQALVTCLANLHFFDQDPVCPANQVRFTDSAQYQELLGIFQTLWMGGTFGLGQPEWCEVPQGLRSHMETEDLTPTSSSGVDVGNGSGGSGESSGPLVPERIELPLKTPNLEPNSRTSENTKDPDNQQLYAPEDSPSSQMKTPISHEFRAEGGHVVGGDLDQKADTMPDVEVQLEKAKDGMEEKDSQGENVKGEESSEEGRDSGQELSRTDSQDREDTQGRVQEEEAGRGLASKVTPDPEVPLLLPAERRENCPEYPRSLSERHSNTSRSHSDPRIETDVDKLSGEWELGCKFPQAQLSPGTSEKGPWRPRRPSLDPDILWVSRMLRKMEKVFMAHLAESMAKMRARWDLQACELLDQMVSELQQDLGWRLQASTDQELRKIQSQVGARLKAREALRWEMSLQTEQHRHCLQGLHNLWGAPALSLDDGALGVRLGREIAGEEFCPCEACLRKKEIPVTRVPIDTMGTASAPITKAFDLQHILQKKGQPAEEGAAEGAPEWRRDREEALQRAEEDFIDQKRDKTEDLPIDSGPKEPEGEEKGLDEKQEEEEKSCVVQVSSEAEAPEGGNPSAGEQSDNAQTAKILEAEAESKEGSHKLEPSLSHSSEEQMPSSTAPPRDTSCLPFTASHHMADSSRTLGTFSSFLASYMLRLLYRKAELLLGLLQRLRGVNYAI
ncbi:retinitis pigmentosa 1-like 1 protein [Erinaceus europaeus]|uniref:Retinitis pigmentosa 1-like 1 protein n=1 Tax=Erinaceus europaeus TaxID=9365 RepID=A0ABM3VUE3_ERIEU|nr:retinitis pigmentosa 1-like 1 protein [Erinaceus europaeus]